MLRGEISRDRLVETIPYLGLDIEEEAETFLRIEYNPNRPDLSTDWGLARALNAFLQFERSWDDYSVSESGITVRVDGSVSSVRPFIVSSLVRGMRLDDDSIKQLIAMQEDLHNGIGRRRKKISIGIHNYDVLRPPIEYLAESPSFSFVPLNGDRQMTMSEILRETEVGMEYGHIVSSHDRYPILRDSAGGVLSFPPIINGELTRLSGETRNLFIDITATDLKTAEDALAVLATTMADAGGNVESVAVQYENSRIVTPNLKPREVRVDLEYAKSLLGLDLTTGEAAECLKRSRMGVRVEEGEMYVSVPRYRFDIIHQVDMVEEIAIGYGLNRIQPTFPEGEISGGLERKQEIIGGLRDSLVGFGLVEVMTFSLIGREMLGDANLYSGAPDLGVLDPKTIEYEFPRGSLIPSLLSVLSRNIHEQYPQRIFEISRVFLKTSDEVLERHALAVALAHSSANFTEAKSYLTSLLAQSLDIQCSTKADSHPTLIEGRTAGIVCSGEKIGTIGEVHPRVLHSFGLRTPVAVFELDLEGLIEERLQTRSPR